MTGARFDGKVAIVTGASRGIGAAVTRRMIDEGATVLLADIDVDGASALAAELGPAASAHALDVADEDQWADLVERCGTDHGGLDVLVNNAGIYVTSPIEETSSELYRRIFAVNQYGVFLGMRAVIAPMRRRGGGSIVNLSSTSGLKGNQYSIAYGSTKWAVRGMSKVAAVELGDDGIRVNSVHPGLIDTPMNQIEMGEERIVSTGTTTPLGRHGDAAEVAAVVCFLASDDASYVSGGEFTVDGAMTAGTRRRPFR